MWNDRLFEKMENVLEQYRRVAEKQLGYGELLSEEFEYTLPLPEIELEKPAYKEMPKWGKKVSERPAVVASFILSIVGFFVSREMETSYLSIAIMALSRLIFIISCVLLFSGRESDEVFASKVRETEEYNKKIDEEYEREYEKIIAPLKARYDEQRQFEFEKWNEAHKSELSLLKDALAKEKNVFDKLCEEAGIPEKYRSEESLTDLYNFFKSRPDATLDEAFLYLQIKREFSK